MNLKSERPSAVLRLKKYLFANKLVRYFRVYLKRLRRYERLTPKKFRLNALQLLVSFIAVIVITAILFKVVSGLLKNPKERSLSVSKDLTLRHDILDRNGNVLALTVPANSLYIRPKELLDKDLAKRALKATFGMRDAEADKIVNSKAGFAWVARNIAKKDLDEFLTFGVVGAHIESGYRRFYPYGRYFSHIVGTTNIDGVGVSGVEYSFNSELLKHNVQLSLDVRIQSILRTALLNSLKRNEAKRAFGIVINPKNGEVLAMASVPDFDPNDRSSFSISDMFNYVTQGVYEQGSTFKCFTLAMALDKGIIKPSDMFDVSKPIVKYGHVFVDDTYLAQDISVPEILMYSSDIGSALVARDLDTSTQKRYFSYMGLFNATPLEIPEKEDSVLPSNWQELTKITLSYGYAMAVSQATAVGAFATLFNGGYYVPLTLVKRDTQKDISFTRVYKPETSALMRKMGRLVVALGTGRVANVPGYNVGGKTGTAELIDHDTGKYDMTKVLSTVMAYFPAEDPKYLMMLSVEEPKRSKANHWSRVAARTIAPDVSEVVSNMGSLLAMPHNKDNANNIDRTNSQDIINFVTEQQLSP